MTLNTQRNYNLLKSNINTNLHAARRSLKKVAAPPQHPTKWPPVKPKNPQSPRVGWLRHPILMGCIPVCKWVIMCNPNMFQAYLEYARWLWVLHGLLPTLDVPDERSTVSPNPSDVFCLQQEPELSHQRPRDRELLRAWALPGGWIAVCRYAWSIGNRLEIDGRWEIDGGQFPEFQHQFQPNDSKGRCRKWGPKIKDEVSK